MKKVSIGFRLTLWYLAIFALAQFVFGAGMWLILRHHLYNLVDASLEAQVDDLQNFMDAQKKDASIAKLQEEVDEAYAIEHSGDYLEIRAEHGEVIYRSVFLKTHALGVTAPPRGSPASFNDRKVDRRTFRFLLQSLEANGHIYSAEIGAPTDDVVKTLTLFRFYLLMFAPLLLLVAAGGGYGLSRRALAPVDSLVRTAREITGANLDSRLEKLTTGDELQPLSDTLNEMLDRIETAFLRVTQFTADASHELRTPVSLIRTEAELALRRSRGEAEYQEALRHILLESERTTMLLEQLLSLARADSGRETLQMQPVDLRSLLRGVVDSWQQVASIRGLKFSASVDDPDAFVMGDETLLHRLVDILLDNAFKFTPASGAVRLSLASKADKLRLTVEDSGVGIPQDEQSKIFERFYRVDKAHSRAQGGAGLGLAIAQWIATQHGGSITVESSPGAGAAFLVDLPKIAAPVSNPQPA